jgi:hypothetical protein
MKDFILFMHANAGVEAAPDKWPSYFAKLRSVGAFEGGSAIGGGETLRKDGTVAPTTDHLAGFILLQAESLTEAKALIAGNPVFESGGSVEIRELPRDGS